MMYRTAMDERAIKAMEQLQATATALAEQNRIVMARNAQLEQENAELKMKLGVE